MPKETFWNSATAVENDGVSEPVLTVTWGAEQSGVYLNGVEFDPSGVERLMNALRRALGKERVVNVTLTADTSAYDVAIDESTRRVRALNEQLRTAGELSRNLLTGQLKVSNGDEEFTASNGAIVWRSAGGPLTVGNYLRIDDVAEAALREYFAS